MSMISGQAPSTSVQAAVEDRLRRLVRLAGALSQVDTARAVAQAAVDAGTEALGADSVSVCLLDATGSRYEILAAGGLRPRDVSDWSSFPADAPVPIVDAVRDDTQIVIADLDDRRARYPIFGEDPMTSETIVVTPLQLSGTTPTGALTVGFRSARALDPSDLAFIQAAADLCGQALHRATLLAYQQATMFRQRFLSDAAQLLARDLDLGTTVWQVAQLTVSGLADGCVLMLAEDDELATVATAHRDPTRLSVMGALQDRRRGANPALLAALESGETQLRPHIDASEMDEIIEDEEHRSLLEQLALSSVILVPLISRGWNLGLMMLLNCDGSRAFDEDDRTFAEELASRAALAIDNARLHTEREALIENLQIALDSKTVIEQAKGVLAEHFGISPREAFNRMRQHARSNRRKLADLAQDVLDGKLDDLG